jgi:centractin
MTLPAVIIDPGSFSIKAGVASDDVPQMIRSVVGRSRLASTGDELRPYVGDSALANSKMVITEPISEGAIEDPCDFDLLMQFVFSSLEVSPMEHPVVVAEPAFSSAPNRETIAELFFESFSVPELNISLQGILSLVGTGRVTGLVLDCGHGSCQTVPIFESYVIPHSIQLQRIGGKDLDILLAKLLALQNVRLSKSQDREIIRKIKHNVCYCRKSPDSETVCGQKKFVLPDGHMVSLLEEQFIPPEAFFNPSLVGAEGSGLASLVSDSIKNSPIDLTKPLVSNIILAGGSSLFEGFPQRLAAEVKLRVSASMAREVKVIAGEERQLATWNGGKAFAELRDSFPERWMNRQEYSECGVEYIHEKVMSYRLA